MGFARVTNEPANYISVGQQSAKDTEASTFYFLKQLNGSGFQLTWNTQTEREGGDGQEVGLRYKDMIKADGALNANGRYGWVARMLAGIGMLDNAGAGNASLAAGATSVSKHVFGGPQASQPYFTVEQRYADEIERADNCMVTTLTITGQAGRPVRVDAQFMVGGTVYQRDVASSLTPVREVNRPFFYPYGSYTFDGFASYSNKVTKFKVEIQRHVDDTIQTTALNKEDVVPLNLDVSFDATLKYETRDYYQKVAYLGGSQVQPDFATGSFKMDLFTSGAAIPGPYSPGVATGYLWSLQLPLLQYITGNVNKLDPDGKTMYLDVVCNTIRSGTWPVLSTIYTDDIYSTPYF